MRLAGDYAHSRNLRITVYDVLEYLASGMTIEEITNDFPELTRDLSSDPTNEPGVCAALRFRKKLGPKNPENSVSDLCYACGCNVLLRGYYENKYRSHRESE